MGISRLGFRGVVGRFFQRIEAVEASGWQGRVGYPVILTDQEKEEYKWLSSTPAIREWIGGRHAKTFAESGIEIKNRRFEGTLGVDIDELRREKSGQLAFRINELGTRTGEHWHKLLTTLIEAPGNGYDGVAFFGATHAEGDSGTQRNDYAAGQVGALDIVAAANPTAAEMAAAIRGVIQEFFSLKDDQGEPMNAGATQFLVMIPPKYFNATDDALKLPIILSGGQAINNALATSRFTIDYVVNPRLTAANNKFYVFRVDGTGKPFILQSELIETDEKDEIFDNRLIKFGVTMLRNVGTMFWQYAAQATFS